jgi:hypothetical protein
MNPARWLALLQLDACLGAPSPPVRTAASQQLAVPLVKARVVHNVLPAVCHTLFDFLFDQHGAAAAATLAATAF